VLVELVALPFYDGQRAMTTVLDLIMNNGFAAVAFEPLFESSDGLRMVELDALFMRPQADSPDWGYGKERRPYGAVPMARAPIAPRRVTGVPPGGCRNHPAPVPTARLLP
jgi:hypothetical protein